MISLVAMHIIGYLSVVLLTASMLNIAKIEWKLKQVLLAIAVLQIINVIVTSVFNITLLTIYLWVLLTVLVFRALFKQPWIKSVFIAVFANFITAIIEYAVILVIIASPESAKVLMLENLYISRAISTAVFALLYVFSRRFKDRESSPFEHFASIHWILYFLAFGFFTDYNLMRMFAVFPTTCNLPNSSEIIVMVLFLLFFLYNLIFLNKLTNNIAKTLKAEQQLEKAEHDLLYANSMVRVSDDLRGFRHDFANFVNSINGFVRQEDLPGLEAYMQKLSVQIVTSQSVEIAEQIKEIPALYGIVLEKIFRAEIRGIHLNVCVLANTIDLKYCSDLDYSRMVGILLDNAIEASEKSKQRTAEFSIRAKRGRRIETMIINSCDGEVDIDRIFEQGYSTKENPSGEGLYQIRRIQRKYQIMGKSIDFETIFRDGSFTQIFKI